MTDLCDCGADLRGCCIDCLTGKPPERPNPPADRPDAVGPAWPAKWPGHCSGCNTAIHEDQPIRRMTDGTYQHERCALEP